MTARTAKQPVSSAASSGLPLIRESLTIAIHNDIAHAVRLTPGEQSITSKFPLPEREQLEDYNIAIATTHRLEEPPDAATRRNIRELRRPLCMSLTRAIPGEIRERIAQNGPGQSLLAIDISLVDEELEKYPWELIGEPGAIHRRARHVVVWRNLVSQGAHPPPKRWQHSLLLAGSASMRHVSPYIDRELDAIKLELASTPVEVYPYPELVPDALKSLLGRYRPAAFHLAAHGTSESLQLQLIRGPTLEELDIIPKVIGAELGNSDVVVGVFNCCDSATVPYRGGRPGAYHISALAGATIVGMSGIIHPYVATIFAQAFYACLAAGGSAIQAYYQGITRIRSNKTYGGNWSLLVMYSRNADIIPFPVGDEARARLSYQHIQSELGVLDQELAELAHMRSRDPAEWFDQASTPATRMECISSYLPALAGIRPPDTVNAAHGDGEVQRVQEDLQDALDDALDALELLGDPDCTAEGRKSALGKLYLFQRRHPRIISRLSREFEDAL